MVVHLKALAKNVWFLTTMVIQHIFSDFLHVEQVLKFLSVESHSPFPRVPVWRWSSELLYYEQFAMPTSLLYIYLIWFENIYK